MPGTDDLGARFRKVILPVKDEMQGIGIPIVIEAAGKYELVQAMARALLNGCTVNPNLWNQCRSNVSLRFGLLGDEVEQAVGQQMIGQLQAEHDWANLVDGLNE